MILLVDDAFGAPAAKQRASRGRGSISVGLSSFLVLVGARWRGMPAAIVAKTSREPGWQFWRCLSSTGSSCASTPRRCSMSAPRPHTGARSAAGSACAECRAAGNERCACAAPWRAGKRRRGSSRSPLCPRGNRATLTASSCCWRELVAPAREQEDASLGRRARRRQREHPEQQPAPSAAMRADRRHGAPSPAGCGRVIQGHARWAAIGPVLFSAGVSGGWPGRSPPAAGAASNRP